MKIGILGVGHIGQTLAQKLSAAGHQVKVANSRGPETIDETSLLGARAVSASEAVDNVEVVILSIPLKRIVDAVPLLAGLPDETVIIDTSNYYPLRDGEITAIEKGQIESLWVAEQIGRPIVKAWNAIGAGSFADKGKPVGSHDRIAIPIAAERAKDREIAMSLVDDTGLDAFDAGALADSWRLQPGSPAYCTDLMLEEMATALDSAERERLPKRRDLAVAVIQERLESERKLKDDFVVRLNRLIYM